jgi:hypothetical protein
MKIGRRILSPRRALTVAVCCGAAVAAVFATVGASSQARAAGSVGPDVTVFDFTDVHSYGSSGGFVGYSVGTRSCNRGSTPVNWCDSTGGCAPGAGQSDHPVIAQNMYRLKNGRFQQIGMSWVKHGFLSLNSTSAGCTGSAGQSCQQPPAGGAQLGVGCSDPYTASLNGDQPMGRRSDVNATTGVFPYPYSSPSGPYTVYDERIKVATTDVDPASNAGALYFVEGQYVTHDDAVAGNSLNNASYRRVTLGNAPNYAPSLTGTFFEQQPAINAWKAQDPTVTLVHADTPGGAVERYDIARKVTELGNGMWHYEYAVHNMNSDRAARSFTIELPNSALFSNAGFAGIAHHSGEPYATDDWTVSTTANSITWSTADFATNPNAHALRWGTTFNFWFDADQPPAGSLTHTLALFKAGDPATLEVDIADAFLNGFKDSFETGDLTTWSAHGP